MLHFNYTSLFKVFMFHIHLHLILLLVAPSQIYPQRTIYVSYPRMKPFIFKNERGEVTGILPKQLDNILKRCLPKKTNINIIRRLPENFK